ncbi:hypothetical protein BC830DRAFT_1101842 [Chytriomyces sp. MP71]|nr:hypothetical protein BC830DRAFT_1101842 [Chytriomyces sp. MP71]
MSENMQTVANLNRRQNNAAAPPKAPRVSLDAAHMAQLVAKVKQDMAELEKYYSEDTSDTHEHQDQQPNDPAQEAHEERIYERYFEKSDRRDRFQYADTNHEGRDAIHTDASDSTAQSAEAATKSSDATSASLSASSALSSATQAPSSTAPLKIPTMSVEAGTAQILPANLTLPSMQDLHQLPTWALSSLIASLVLLLLIVGVSIAYQRRDRNKNFLTGKKLFKKKNSEMDLSAVVSGPTSRTHGRFIQIP